ncbi:MAG: hypothetical protein ABI836_09055 [Gemmatimonadota bacterium]
MPPCRPAAAGRIVVWAPDDSLDGGWLAALVDSLGRGVAGLDSLIGSPYPWQRIGSRPLNYYLSPGRFVSHASGNGAIFISLTRVRGRNAPFLHEAAHELLAPPVPFSPDEYRDSVAIARAEEKYPLWLNQGFADYVAQAVSAATGFKEGDVFEIGGLAVVDSVCAARRASSPRRKEILSKVGDQGFLDALFTTERADVAPIYYACSQSFTQYVVDRIGVRRVVALFPHVPDGTWLADLKAAAGAPLDRLRVAWLGTLGVQP